MKREKRHQIVGLGLALLAIFFVALCFAGQSPNYWSYPQVVDCGGGKPSSTNYQSRASIAQPAIGERQSVEHISYLGYLYAATVPLAPSTNKKVGIAKLEAMQVPWWAQGWIDAAIAFILDSLNPILWVGPWHLNTDFIPGDDDHGDDRGESKGSPGNMPTPIGMKLKLPGILYGDGGNDERVKSIRSNSMNPILPVDGSHPGIEFNAENGDRDQRYWETVFEKGEEATEGPIDPAGDDGDDRRYGELVFNYEREATQILMTLACFLPELREELGEVIGDLVTADSTLAQVALDEAIAGEGDPELIKKAQAEMERAEWAKSNGQFDEAIFHYGRAWRYSVDALHVLLAGGLGGAQAEAESELLPRIFALHQNHPNPWGELTIIHYQLPKPIRTSLKVYDVTGRLVRVLVNEKREAGYYRLSWDGKSSTGTEVSAGIYFYRLEAGDFTATRKMVVLK